MQRLLCWAIVTGATLTAQPAFAQENYAIGKRMLKSAKAEAHFKALDLPSAIMLLHRQSGLLCQFDVDAIREVSGNADTARCRNANYMGDYTLTASRSAKTLQAEHEDLRKTMARHGALASPTCDVDKRVPYCQVSATRSEGGVVVYTEAIVGVRDGWVFTVQGSGEPGQRVDLMTKATFSGMVDTPEP
jgi:hypothetical protein